MTNHPPTLVQRLADYKPKIEQPTELVAYGKLIRMVGLTLEAVGLHVSIGSRCYAYTQTGKPVECEVVGFAGEKIYLMPIGDTMGLAPGARMQATDAQATALVGDGLLGRVIDGNGKPLDELGKLQCEQSVSLYGQHINPLKRDPIDKVIDVGVRAINALLTIGQGQRIGLFAGSGVGKSVLLSMLARYTDADVIVVGLIGERGREVQEFIQRTLGPEVLQKSCIVVAPADTPPLVRTHAALRATSIAEYFRDQGKKVLLLMDSVTRFAQAQRQIGLAIGEPPATKGYPPSVFTTLPQLIERAGCGGENSGTITAFYTVFVEGDDLQDPIADSARAILDGHIVLARKLADAGHFPAIDIQASISRVMDSIITDEQKQLAQRLRHLYATYQENKDLINVGAYMPGSNPELDTAIKEMPRILNFLRQPQQMQESFDTTLAELANIMSPASSLATAQQT